MLPRMTHRDWAVEVLEATKGASGSALRVHLAIIAGHDIGEHSRAVNIALALNMTERSVYRALAELRVEPAASEPRQLPAVVDHPEPATADKTPSRARRKVAATEDELMMITAIIDEFNQTFGTDVRSVGAHAPYIVRRLRNPDFSDVTLDDHRAIIRHAKLNQWFSAPTPRVIYGNDAVFDDARSRWSTGSVMKPKINGRLARQQELLSEPGQ